MFGDVVNMLDDAAAMIAHVSGMSGACLEMPWECLGMWRMFAHVLGMSCVCQNNVARASMPGTHFNVHTPPNVPTHHGDIFL